MGEGHGEKLSRMRERAIAALLSEPTVPGAAKKAGVSHTTLKDWMKLPDFQKEYRAARKQLLERVVARLLNSTSEAVETLKRNMNCGKPGVEVRSALALIQQSLHGVEVLDLEVEMQELRQLVEKLTGDKQ
jgi:hypothetical protein